MNEVEEIPFSTYLTLPSSTIPLCYETAQGFAPWAVSENVQPRELSESSDETKQVFRRAIRALRLNEAHTTVMKPDTSEEDDCMFADDDTETIERSMQIECFDCGEIACQSEALKVGEPELMMLAVGDLGVGECYDHKYM